MERVHADDHPLSSTYNNLGILGPSYSSDSGQHSRSPAASLIQSAARSVLDEATPSTALSDGGSDSCSCADGAPGFSRPTPSPSLSSLQIKTLPALPNEQDRKRFVGCLAAILASSYDYDKPDGPEDQNNISYSYLDLDDEPHQNEEQPRNSDASLFAQSQSTSFEYSDIEEIHETWASATPNVKETDNLSSASRPAARQKVNSVWGNTVKAKAAISRQRHRRRRYDTMCKFLVSSAELLLLDESVSKAFVPMLEKVLVPQANSNNGEKSVSKRPPLWKGAGSRRNTRPPTAPPVDKEAPSPEVYSSYRESDPNQFLSELELGYLPRELDEDDILRPFLESLTPGAGFRCIALLLLQYLLTSDIGYDARIRHVIKKLGVVVLVHDMERDPVEHVVVPPEDGIPNGSTSYNILQARATRKFESLEHSIARRLIRLSESSGEKKNSRGSADKSQSKKSGITREQFFRGVKIGSAGIVAGTLFAVTGGIAAPGIYAGLSAVAGSVAATTAVATLTSTAVVTTIFGVGGGGLAAYKMNRRTQGLTEFEFRKETNNDSGEKSSNEDEKPKIEAELFSTICLSGWLRDNFDFQRPWGVQPTNPRLVERLELLERFYSIHSPDHVPKCARILAIWRGEEKRLWNLLREKYGTDPDHLFPLTDGPKFMGSLTLEQEEVLDELFVELGYNSAAPNSLGPAEQQATPFERMREGWKVSRKLSRKAEKNNSIPTNTREFDSMHGPISMDLERARIAKENELNVSFSENTMVDSEEYTPPKHLATVWDYQATYGGEMYTVRWESHLLKRLCDCVIDLAVDVVTGATRQILKQTVLSTLVAAIAWPAYLINVANMIDGDWTLAVERTNQAGKELARTLLFSRAGHRPVTLVGFSFGARIIYSCLKELARYQEEWEEQQELKRDGVKDNPRLRKLDAKFRGMREPSSIIEDAILMGLPNHLSLLSWKACRQVVGGRLVNCYSNNDLMLSLMFQVKRISGNFSSSSGSLIKPVCGTCPVHVPGVENIDVSDLVSGHEDYCLVTGKILQRVRHGQPIRSDSNANEDFEVAQLPEAGKKLEF